MQLCSILHGNQLTKVRRSPDRIQQDHLGRLGKWPKAVHSASGASGGLAVLSSLMLSGKPHFASS